MEKKKQAPKKQSPNTRQHSGQPSNGRAQNKRFEKKPVRHNKPMHPSETPQGEPESIQWYPGHMAKTRRLLQEKMRSVDAVIEVVDARIPVSSRNPDLDSVIGNKPRLLLLAKADLADENATRRWITWYRSRGIMALAVDCKSGKGMRLLLPALQDLLRDQIEKWEAKGITPRIRVMVVGIPNVGKSSFINRLNTGAKAQVEDRPGVTRQNRWFVADGLLLLDTPGVLWPKFDDHTVALHLAFTGAIKNKVLNMEEMACELLQILATDYPALLSLRYKIDQPPAEDRFELLQQIARKRGMLVSGGEADTERASIMLLDEYRSGKLGRITLEKPEERS